MSGPEEVLFNSAELQEAGENYRRRLTLCSILFALFFVFYIASAMVQTPQFADIAGIPCLGMPLGLFLSLMIFPVSWVIIIVFFLRWR